MKDNPKQVNIKKQPKGNNLFGGEDNIINIFRVKRGAISLMK